MIKIEISCDPADLDAHVRALGWMPNPAHALAGSIARQATTEETRAQIRRDNPNLPGGTAPATQTAATVVEIKASPDEQPGGFVAAPAANSLGDEMAALEQPDDLKSTGADIVNGRVRGQPSPGRKRRTPAEVAEDAAFEAGAKSALAHVAAQPSAAHLAAISTGEPRIDPAAAAQDEADEAAESAAQHSGPPTIDHLRGAVARWTATVGYAEVQKNLVNVIGSTIAEFADKKPSEETIAGAIGRVELAMTGSTAPNGAAPPPAADKGAVIEAIADYAWRYEGLRDPKQMVLTKEDMPKLLTRTFGKDDKGQDVVSIGQISDYGRAVAAIQAATRDNPFQREVRQ